MNKNYLEILSHLDAGKNVVENCCVLYEHYEKLQIKNHVERVALKAASLGFLHGVNTDDLIVAAYLHDISGIIGRDDYIGIALTEFIPILDEERLFPMLLHQKISKNIASQIFTIKNEFILNAIECHTTLKANSSLFDKILFIADKLEWDQCNHPQYYEMIDSRIKESIDYGIEEYLEYRMTNRNDMLILHPWLESAYKETHENRIRRTIAST